jgi:hypothetical protein
MEVRQPLSVEKLASRKIVERVPKQIRSLHPIESLKPRSGSRHHHLRALIAKSPLRVKSDGSAMSALLLTRQSRNSS